MDEALDFDNSDKILRLIVDRGELPQYIYKYTDLNTLKLILAGASLRFSKPSEFNDPFDCNLTIDTNNSKSEIDEHISIQRKSKGLSKKQVNDLRQKLHNPSELHRIINDSVKQAKETFGVTCFSKTINSLLMWAHYADKHKGVCLKYDLLADAEFFMTPFPVKYEQLYPSYNYIRNRDGLGKFLLETKSTDWKYENEIRVMKRGAGFYQFNKDALCEIIFGAKTAQSEIESVEKMVKSHAYNQIKFKYASVSSQSFKLEFD